MAIKIINDYTTLEKLSALSEESCTELTATTKRRKLTERDHSIKESLVQEKEQLKEPTVAESNQHRAEGTGKAGDDGTKQSKGDLVFY